MLRIEAFDLVCDEFKRAEVNFGPIHSLHEGYAILLEEVDELWELTKQKQEHREIEKVRAEAKQIAAMALRIMVDLC